LVNNYVAKTKDGAGTYTHPILTYKNENFKKWNSKSKDMKRI